jgi:hypothetical protein
MSTIFFLVLLCFLLTLAVDVTLSLYAWIFKKEYRRLTVLGKNMEKI